MMMHDHDDVHDEDLRQVARRLGAAAADRLDVERIAQAVLDRLRAGDAPARAPVRWMRAAWLRAAAVVVLMIGGGVLVYTRLNTPEHRQPRRETPQASELAGLSSSELQDVMTGLSEPLELPGVVHAGEAGVEDLSEPQLQSLLKSMED